jgi:hypothetical protein
MSQTTCLALLLNTQSVPAVCAITPSCWTEIVLCSHCLDISFKIAWWRFSFRSCSYRYLVSVTTGVTVSVLLGCTPHCCWACLQQRVTCRVFCWICNIHFDQIVVKQLRKETWPSWNGPDDCVVPYRSLFIHCHCDLQFPGKVYSMYDKSRPKILFVLRCHSIEYRVSIVTAKWRSDSLGGKMESWTNRTFGLDFSCYCCLQTNYLITWHRWYSSLTKSKIANIRLWMRLKQIQILKLFIVLNSDSLQ